MVGGEPPPNRCVQSISKLQARKIEHGKLGSPLAAVVDGVGRSVQGSSMVVLGQCLHPVLVMLAVQAEELGACGGNNSSGVLGGLLLLDYFKYCSCLCSL